LKASSYLAFSCFCVPVLIFVVKMCCAAGPLVGEVKHGLGTFSGAVHWFGFPISNPNWALASPAANISCFCGSSGIFWEPPLPSGQNHFLGFRVNLWRDGTIDVVLRSYFRRPSFCPCALGCLCHSSIELWCSASCTVLE
jgi:hypothetical protein